MMAAAIRILYVDDEPGLLDIGKLFLERNGDFSVTIIDSAPAALALLKKENFDAIISDYQMPEMDGIAFLKKLKFTGNTTPFIIFTGRGREEIVIEALNEGADFYLQKGGEPRSQFAELSHKIHQSVQQRRAVASIRDHERREADIINFLPDATFAIDTSGVVIAWNRSMEMMTGVASDQILGKGNYEYALPFYLERRPILIDLIIRDDPVTAGKYPAIRRDGTTLVSEITIPHFNNGRGAALWFIASPLYDMAGTIVGAIESIREITERKQAEEALAESEKRFRELSDLLPQIVYETDTNGNLKYANHIAFEQFGYSEDEFRQGLNVLQMLAYGDRERAAADLRNLFEGRKKTAPAGEYQALRKDGSTFPISIYASLVFVNERITGIRGIIVDNTERKRADAIIHESEQKYRTVFENTGTATVLIENDSTIILANSEFERLSGYPKDEIENQKKWTEFVKKEDLDRMLAQHRMRRKDQKHALTHYEFRFIPRSGVLRDIYLTIDVIPGTTKSVASLLDITERKRGEDDLITANREYTNLLSQIQDIYYRTDTEGRLIKASHSLATLLGYDDISECLGRNIAEDFYFNPADRKPFVEEISRQGKVTDYEVRLKKKDGAPVLISTSSHLYYDTAGKIIGVEGTFRDITERKRQDHILKTQLDLGLALPSIRGLHDTLETCLNAAIEISGMDAGGIYLVNRSNGSVDLIVSRNLGDEFLKSVSYYPGSSVNTRIVMAGKPVYVPFSKTGIVHTPVQEHEGLKTAAIIPILSDSRVIASLNISSHTDDEIPANARVALETIATQIGAAIERIRADDALADSELRYRNIVEDQTEFISRFLPDGTHVFVNEAYCRYFGLKRDDLLGHRFRPDIPADDKERVSNFFASLTPDNPVNIIEHRIIMQDGSIRWQRWSDRAIFDPLGKVTEYQSVGRDVTDKKDAEIALLASEERFHLLAENLQDPVIILGFDASVQYANNAAFRLAGIPHPTEGDTVSIAPFLDKESQERAIADLDMIRVNGGPRIGEYRMRTAQGEMKWVEAVGIRIPWQGTDRDLIALRDITKRKQDEETLRESENKFASVFYGSPVALTLVSAIDGTFVDVNDAFVTATGYSRDEVIGVTSEALGIFEDGGERERLASTLRAQRTVHDMEIRCRIKTGEIRPCLFSSGLILIGGRPHILSTIRDITDRKQVEDALKMANRKLNILSSITRHDINNQLAVLVGYLRILEKKQSDPTLNVYSQKIASAAERISAMIRFTKEYEQVGVKDPAWQDCHTLVDTATKEVTLGHVKVKNMLNANTEVFADPLIVKVFYNLMDNAMRYGGKITTIAFSFKERNGDWIIICEDDGEGVLAEEKEKIFDWGIGKNTGLGLALSREILDITGITLNETGEPGKGARFEMTVPKGAWRMVDVGRKANGH